MRAVDLIPGTPAICERCKERIYIGTIPITHDHFLNILLFLRGEFHILCTYCEGILHYSPSEWEELLRRGRQN